MIVSHVMKLFGQGEKRDSGMSTMRSNTRKSFDHGGDLG
jgi:hypothetical protein